MTTGVSLPHDSALLHVTGRARYVDDIPVPAGTLHLAFGQSDEAHAKIDALDLTAVLSSPGVVRVLTAKDMPFANNASASPYDEPVLAEGEVYYIGQPIFLVIATSHRAARIAARRAKISYTPLPALLTIEDAWKAHSMFGEPVIWQKGDAETALSNAPHIVEGWCEVGGQEHFYLEGQVALAEPQDQGMVIRCSSQHPTEIQHKVSEALGLGMNDVRVEMRRMGGGFGGKESQGNPLAIACAVAATLTGRPCKMRYDRDDDITITGKRHNFRIRYRIGADDEGHLLGAEFLQLARCGWAQDLSHAVCDRAMLHAENAYVLPAVRIESQRLRTNTQSNTAFRGFGGPQGIYGIEVALDHLAHEMGIDPIALRLRNLYPADPPFETTPYGQLVEDCPLGELIPALQKSANYAERKAEIREWNSKNRTLKRGIGFVPVKFGISFTLTQLNQAGALVSVYQDGSVILNHGGTEMGQGLHQKCRQVAARVFGLPEEKIRITATDTSKVPNTSATAASSGADMNGMAVRQACETIRERLTSFAASRAGCGETEVLFADGRVTAPGFDVSFEDLVRDANAVRISLSSTGHYATPKISWDAQAGKGRPFYYFAYGAAITEVVIDTLTGENRILRTDILHDAGRSLNPAIDIGQVEGAFVQGAGWLTTEELVWNDKGRLMTHAPSTYKIPACADRPHVFNVNLWDRPNREETIFRSKAVGEPPFNLGISAFLALSDACQACGPDWPALRAPATAEAVLAAVGRAKGGK